MNDDTRDIAIRADESSASAHKRLDGINGQIGGLRSSHERMREDFNKAHLDLVESLVTVKTTVSNALKVAGALVALTIAISSGVTVYALTHAHHGSSPPTRAAQHAK